MFSNILKLALSPLAMMLFAPLEAKAQDILDDTMLVYSHYSEFLHKCDDRILSEEDIDTTPCAPLPEFEYDYSDSKVTIRSGSRYTFLERGYEFSSALDYFSAAFGFQRGKAIISTFTPHNFDRFGRYRHEFNRAEVVGPCEGEDGLFYAGRYELWVFGGDKSGEFYFKFEDSDSCYDFYSLDRFLKELKQDVDNGGGTYLGLRNERRNERAGKLLFSIIENK